MKTEASAKLMSYITSPGGNVLIPLILAGVSVGAVHLAAAIPEAKPFLTEENLNTVSGFLAAVVIALVNGWTNGRLKSGTEKVQEILNKALPESAKLDVDGVAGPQTQEGAAKATGQ